MSTVGSQNSGSQQASDALSVQAEVDLVQDDALRYVLESVLGQPHNSPMAEALIHKDYFDIPSLIGMSTSDIDGLTTLQTQAIGGDAYTARVQMSSGLRVENETELSRRDRCLDSCAVE